MGVHRIASIFILIIGIVFSFIIPFTEGGKGERDFIRYWTASRLLINGENPYDPINLTNLQSQIRPSISGSTGVVQAWNPPWLLILMAPMTLIPFDWAVRVWIILTIFLLTISILIVLRILNRPVSSKEFILLLAAVFIFGNTINTVKLGQISGLLLFGYVVCVWFLTRKNFIFAGASLLLLIIKPHITFLCLLVIFIWMVRYRKWNLVAGLFGAIIISFLVAWLFYPGWLGAYTRTLFTLPYQEIYTSTVGSFMETVFGLKYFNYLGLLLIPLAFPFAKLVDREGWLTSLNLALLVSIPFSPYGFSFDHIILLPAVIQMLVWVLNYELPARSIWFIGIGLILNYLLLLYMMMIVELPYYWTVWGAIGLMILYIFAWRSRREFAIQPV